MILFYKIEPCPLCNSEQIQLCRDGNNVLKDTCKCRECGCTALRSSWEMRESHIAASTSEPVATQTVQDADRFAWWFSEAEKRDFLTTYFEGVNKKWSTDQWRAAIDYAMKSTSADGEAG